MKNFEIPQAEEGRELPENITEIETNVSHYRIVYSDHRIPNRPEAVRGVDGIILEGFLPYNPENAAMGIVEYLTRFEPQYYEVVREAIREETPIFFLDARDNPATTGKIDKTRLPEKWQIGAAELLIALILLSDIEIKKQMSRRRFLNESGRVLGSLFLSSPALQFIFRELSALPKGEPKEKSLFRRGEKLLGSINRTIHPETRSFNIDTRNTLIAQKSETVARVTNGELGRKPILAIIIGASHMGLERELKKEEEERMEELREDLRGALLQNRHIVRIDFLPKDGRRLSDLTLEELIRGTSIDDLREDSYAWRTALQNISGYMRVTLLEDPAFRRIVATEGLSE